MRTNVVRHAGAATAVVWVGYEPDGLTVEVADDGHGAGGHVHAGFGLLGMRERDGGIAVVGEAADGAEAIALARRLRPDVVLMDVRMPVVDGLEATRRILSDERNEDVRVVMLTTFELVDYLFDALRAVHEPRHR